MGRRGLRQLSRFDLQLGRRKRSGARPARDFGQGSERHHLRRTQTQSDVECIARRSALRANRRLARPEKTVKLNHAVLLTGYARHNMNYWKLIANNLSKAGWSWAMSRRLIPTGEQSGLLTHIAT